VQNYTVIPHDFQMLAVAPHFLDGLTNPWGHTIQPWCFESHHFLADERNP
jgi:hypothetical protein